MAKFASAIFARSSSWVANDDGRPLASTLAYEVDDHLAVGSVERSRRLVGVQYVSMLEHGARKTDWP